MAAFYAAAGDYAFLESTQRTPPAASGTSPV